MNWKNWTPLVLAVVLGLVAAKVTRDALKRRAGAGAQQRVVKVVVAAGAVPPGQELTASMVRLALLATDAPPANAFTDPTAVVGRVTTAPLINGQPVLEDLLAPKGSGTGIQALVPKGMRAITVEVNETSGLGGMLVPGCRVDVVSTLGGASRDDTVACTIVQDVLVQAVGQRLSAVSATERVGTGEPVRSVTLVVTPHDAEAIELASSMGRPRLVLRGSNDRMPSETVGVSFGELRGNDTERLVNPVYAVTAPPVILPSPVVTKPPVQPVYVPPPVFAPPVVTTPPVATTPPPVVATAPPATQPTKPGGAAATAEATEDTRPKRSVTLFRGAVRTEVLFDLPEAPAQGSEAPSAQSPKATRAPSDSAVTRTGNEPIER